MLITFYESISLVFSVYVITFIVVYNKVIKNWCKSNTQFKVTLLFEFYTATHAGTFPRRRVSKSLQIGVR